MKIDAKNIHIQLFYCKRKLNNCTYDTQVWVVTGHRMIFQPKVVNRFSRGVEGHKGSAIRPARVNLTSGWFPVSINHDIFIIHEITSHQCARNMFSTPTCVAVGFISFSKFYLFPIWVTTSLVLVLKIDLIYEVEPEVNIQNSPKTHMGDKFQLFSMTRLEETL